MIGALWLKSELNDDEFKIVNKYIKKMYRKFLKPVEFEKKIVEYIRWLMEELQY